MKPLLQLSTALALLLCWIGAPAHDGPHAPGEEHLPVSAAATGGVRRWPDGSLSVPKPLQQLLGLSTTRLGETMGTRTLMAEVQAEPEAPVLVSAGESGTLEATAEGWPLPGARVHAGQVLAWLRPAVTQKDRARRKAQGAEIEQRLAIATLNADRLRLQSAVTPEGGVATGNIYFEQMLAEQAGYRAQLAELRAGLDARVPVLARTAGVLQETPLRQGDVVSVGAPLFRLHDASRLRLVATSFEPALAGRPPVARWGDRALRFKGQQPVEGGPGWQWLFDADGLDALQSGQLVEIRISRGEGRLPAGACQRETDGSGLVWLQGEGERFTPLRFAGCTPAAAETARLLETRLVTDGASLLSRYRQPR